MKQLITFISTEDKTMEQVQEKAVLAMEKFQQVHKKSLTNQQLVGQFNQWAESQGSLLPQQEDNMQVIFHQKLPVDPKKK